MDTLNINQEFKTEIVQVAEDGTETVVFDHLAAAITAFEREIPDPVVSDLNLNVSSDDEEDEEESEPEDEEEDEDGFLVADDHGVEPDGDVRVMARVSQAMLSDFKQLEASEAEHKLRFIFSGLITREFDIGNDATLVLNNGCTPSDSLTPLEVEIFFDVYGQDTRY